MTGDAARYAESRDESNGGAVNEVADGSRQSMDKQHCDRSRTVCFVKILLPGVAFPLVISVVFEQSASGTMLADR